MAFRDTKRPIFMDDIFLGIFGYLPEGKRQFHYDMEKMHKFFYEIRDKYPKILGSLAFNTDRMFPRCEAIAQAISNLQYCGLLSSWGMNFNPNEFSKKCRPYFEENNKKNFSGSQLKELKEISKKFEKRFSLEKILV